jgi:predicted DsbA family dithiol-disulfide isomerase
MAVERVQVTHFSDVLCVWAYVSQVRIDELLRNFPDRVAVEMRYFHVFGNVPGKIDAGWKDRGGAAAYGEHVRDVVGRFGHVPVHPRAWVEATPRSSMPAHLLLCAARLLEAQRAGPPGTHARLAWALREAFFRDAEDIADQAVLKRVARDAGIDAGAIGGLLDNGAAHAALAEDLDLARQHAVQASPTLLFNEGRQRLTGNVGYRIIEANVRELLEGGAPGQWSWC